MERYKIAVIPGDGIGKEVMPAGLSVLQKVADEHEFKLSFTNYPWSCETYHETGQMME